MSLNKILSTLCAVIVCLTFVLSSPIPVPENMVAQLVELEAISPIQTTSIESNPNNLPIRIARHLLRQRGCRWCGGGYAGGAQNVAQSSAFASAESNGYGGSQSQAQSQSQSANFKFGPFSASLSSSSASASSSSGGGRGGRY